MEQPLSGSESSNSEIVTSAALLEVAAFADASRAYPVNV